MTEQINHTKKITIALAWCLAWGDRRESQFDLAVLKNMRQALTDGGQIPEEVRSLVDQVKQLQNIDLNKFPDTFQELQNKYADLWNQRTKIGLVYGGATKIKQYVFEAAKLSDIRGASALLDRINLVDIPAFFGHYDESAPKPKSAEDCLKKIREWLERSFPKLGDALIPELLIYSTGGNVLAFCPAAFVDDLANAIERRYTEETLTANSCAVGQTFNLLEVRFGLLNNAENFWIDSYLKNHQNPLVESYFGGSKDANKKTKSSQQLRDAFIERKNFNELVTSLAIAFNKRRSGNTTGDRPSRAYPPIFETHPYLVRDESDRRPAIFQATELGDQPYMSESLARKRLAGQIAKRDGNLQWYDRIGFDWKSKESSIPNWIQDFSRFVEKKHSEISYLIPPKTDEALSLREIGQAGKGFVGYIYADGNNMGGYIQKNIQTPEQYRQFSEDIFEATKDSAYYALAQHLQPTYVHRESEAGKQSTVLIHPFEIIAIGGDDVLIIVPADKALAIAQTIGEKFEEILKSKGRYDIPSTKKPIDYSFQRYQNGSIKPSESFLSTSLGVLITAENTPIYYAEKLVGQLLKSAKKKAKALKTKHGYHGGTIDFLSMKSVTMLSSNVESFRKEGLSKGNLRFFAAPYTLHEIGGLIEVVKVLKSANFPRSQLYQLRSLLENGKQTGMINYRYFRVRLKDGQSEIRTHFEDAWCKPKTNNGNLAPWMTGTDEQDKIFYETIWRDLVDIYDFVDVETNVPQEANS
ncbi:type III-B CRISPR-associated protein Cas10/Cmr2 [Pseudanabaena sp. FACHB-1277]|uniref:Type III-B CRISPR-associated protein Cas10/Cmr2 n=1 Tax=Pseudanabaena cinerea FACHB-1277 TaxID=2949581 RepID=A0A926UYB5_9CYAN|nr:type III-B CRISPR-associated protein Cas10/Cmr2 [Pseudanabaena cinerea]MBD2152232.1 type III-B CRISPR-associated protein Cas10/Cmr2 [Pseudanabaena cinerea FACHB-1277]